MQEALTYGFSRTRKQRELLLEDMKEGGALEYVGFFKCLITKYLNSQEHHEDSNR